MEEIYIDTGNTINVAVQSHALLLLTKAKEQHKRYEGQLRLCRQVSPHADVTYFVKAVSQENSTLTFVQTHQEFKPAVALAADDQKSLCRQLILDRLTEESVLRKRSSLQAKAMEMTVSLKHNQDIISTLSNVCQRSNRLTFKLSSTSFFSSSSSFFFFYFWPALSPSCKTLAQRSGGAWFDSRQSQTKD
ncbi:hypothetical protein ElyMa_002760200 [Elysia marginata]|uniref:Uncharacterized protein n=1 Tax=Elysia marginata TaxID=1093978 RepID=A0AAV4HK14_9GAST|nr:hypothetical protein ElyMa_002760200 [Elysia marginata]